LRSQQVRRGVKENIRWTCCKSWTA